MALSLKQNQKLHTALLRIPPISISNFIDRDCLSCVSRRWFP